jgi:hypothetical protein
MTDGFTIVGFYTDNYKDSAEHFAKSCVSVGVPFYLERVDDKGGWHKTTSFKPTFLRQCLDRFTCDIVYCDVDAEFVKFPVLFNSITGDISFFKGQVWNHSHDEVLSGTVYLKNNGRVYNFVKRWEDACKQSTDWDQRLIEPNLDGSIVVEPLPVEYCAIFDSPRAVGKDIVIRHLQHSRTKKR